MSDNTAQAVNIPIKPLEKKDEQGNLVASITPVIEVVQRGEFKSNPYPVIKVTKDNINQYLKLRGLENVLEDLNATERQRAQGALTYTLIKSFPAPEEYEYDSLAFEDGGEDADTKKPFTRIILDKLNSVIDLFYSTLLEGKVRSGETIESLNEDKKAFLEQMNVKMNLFRTTTDKEQALALMAEAGELSAKYQECEAKIEDIRKNRTPRKTKAQKAAELAAAKAAEAAKAQAAA